MQLFHLQTTFSKDELQNHGHWHIVHKLWWQPSNRNQSLWNIKFNFCHQKIGGGYTNTKKESCNLLTWRPAPNLGERENISILPLDNDSPFTSINDHLATHTFRVNTSIQAHLVLGYVLVVEISCTKALFAHRDYLYIIVAFNDATFYFQNKTKIVLLVKTFRASELQIPFSPHIFGDLISCKTHAQSPRSNHEKIFYCLRKF
jgi:hypothetical protein